MGGVEECGGRGKVCGERGGGECGTCGGVWEGGRFVGEMEECDGRGKVCCGRGGGVWERWRGVGGVEECGWRCKVCGVRGGGEIGRGGVWVGQVSSARQSR